MDVSLSKVWEIVKDRVAWHDAVHGVTKSYSWLSDWTYTSVLTVLWALIVLCGRDVPLSNKLLKSLLQGSQELGWWWKVAFQPRGLAGTTTPLHRQPLHVGVARWLVLANSMWANILLLGYCLWALSFENMILGVRQSYCNHETISLQKAHMVRMAKQKNGKTLVWMILSNYWTNPRTIYLQTLYFLR